MENWKEKIAAVLLEIGAVKIQPGNPFTWASGWKSPIYCDNRLSLSHPKERTLIKNALVDCIKQDFPGANAIAGVATAGIPQAALVAEVLSLPMLYVRSKPKGHGRENLIEGEVDKNAKILVIEDLISTGGSSIKAALALRDAGYEVMGLLATFTYGFQQADENFKKANIPFAAISDYQTLLQTALKQGKVQENELSSLENWRKSPETWGV